MARAPQQSSACAFISEFGNESVIKVNTIELPKTPGEDDALIRIKACAISAHDIEARRGTYSKILPSRRLPCLGYEFTGVVEAVGQYVTNVAVGDVVVGLVPLDAAFGACAEYCTRPAHSLIKLPTTVDPVAAACTVGPGFAALLATGKLARVTAGDLVLVLDAATSFGLAAIEIALWLQATVTAAVATVEQKDALTKALGARASSVRIGVVSAGEFTSWMLHATCGEHYDAIIETTDPLMPAEKRVNVTPHHLSVALGAGAQWVTVRHGLQLDPPDTQSLLFKSSGINFLFTPTSILAPNRLGVVLHYIEKVVNLLADGHLTPAPSVNTPLSDVAQAHSNYSQLAPCQRSIIVPSLSSSSQAAPVANGGAAETPADALAQSLDQVVL